jgi:hypothetical protein
MLRKSRKDNRHQPTFFKKDEPEHCTQNVTVNVTVNEPDDGIAEALSGCFKCCFGLAKKAAE